MASPFFQAFGDHPVEPTKGLGVRPRSEWPVAVIPDEVAPIDRLGTDNDLHKRVLDYLMERLRNAEHAMSKFHGRWRANESRNQAWIDLKSFDKIMKDANDSGKSPKAVDIVIPYSFATLSTISTYMLQVFTGRKPMLQVGTYGTGVRNAQMMEVLLQYQSDHMRLIKHLWQWFNDAGLYGVGILRNRWKSETAMRTKRVQRPVFDLLSGTTSEDSFREQEEVTVYEGNVVEAQDPFMFFPDPRVPMIDIPDKAEYVFWRVFQGKHTLLRAQEQGLLKWVERAPSTATFGDGGIQASARDLLTGGIAHPGASIDNTLIGPGYYKVDQCSIDIIPRELGLGVSEKVEKWIFTVLNGQRIVQAEQQIDDHGHHPVIVIEPYTMGYALGSPGMSDYIGPFQDSMSWFLNSHMENVRAVINDSIVVDPSLIEMKDLRNPEPGKIIRLKRTAFGRDVRTAITQLNVTDITRGHVDDMNTFMEIGQRISAVSDNLLGLQDSGGRKTATEVRTANEAAASRLAATAKIISAQGMTELAYQMSLNTQQYISQDFYLRVVGEDGKIYPLVVDPEGITGDFYYPVHDGTLPLDRIAMLDMWTQILQGVLQDQELRQQYSVGKIFEYVAELGGAKNIRNFKMNPQDPEVIQQQAQAGNLAPVPGGQGPSGLVQAALPQPGNRLAGALQ